MSAADGGPKDYFGMELGYNDPLGISASQQYNGNISAIKWSTNLGLGFNDTELEIFEPTSRGYGFTYDPLNRLKTSAHFENTVGWNAATSFHENIDEYDLNGNIRKLKRTGKDGNNMDLLDYTYSGNRLMKVIDDGNDSEGFKDGNVTGDDYLYDDNGNMVTDKNKDIASIEYNYLNLPARVVKTDGQYVKYIYNAAGVKMSQEVHDASDVLKKKTDYLGEFFYENDTLKFVNHEDGRIVMTGSEPEYQYTLKDHLGNTRITFTSKPQAETFAATLEDNTQTEEQNTFGSYSRVTNDLLDHTDAGAQYDKALVLNGGYAGQVGLTKSFTVVPGDKVSASVFAKYIGSGGPPGDPGALVDFALALTEGFGLTPNLPGEGATAFEALNAFGSFIASGGRDDEDTDPKGFLNILVFDKDYNLVDIAYQQIDASSVQSGATKAPHELLSREVEIRQAGYVYVFLSNEGTAQKQIGFDDLTVTHEHSDVIQQDDYYPFGATFNSHSRENSLDNKRLYQSKEYQNELSLNLYDFEWRQYDPWSARTTTMDPHAEKYFTQSPYSWSANNPIKFIDPDGRDWYLNLYNGQVQYIEGSGSQFDKAYVHLAADGATTGEIQDALSSRGYNYALNGNIPGGYQVDTKAQYKGWIMMQTFSEENVGAIMWMGGNAWARGLPTSKAAGRATSVWGMNPSQRGFMIEKGLGGNLPNNFPVIDKLANGVATSIKSVDLTAKTYQKNGALLGALKGYINQLDNFSVGRGGGQLVREGIEFESKQIQVAIQPGKASLSQWEQIGKAMQYAKDKGIEFTLSFVK